MNYKDRFSVISLIVFLTLLTAVSGWAQKLYVKPSSEITMRRGQGTDFKIIAVLKDGTPVEMLAEADDWAQVRLESGREGWVLRRYLSDAPPLGQQVEQLQREKEVLTETTQSLKSRVDQLTAEKDEVERRLSDEKAEVERELNQCVVERTTINEDFLNLQEDTADVIQTKTDLDSARTRVEDLESQVGKLQKENDRLGKTEMLKWFLAGGGVLFLGWIIGMVSRKSRKKRSSLL
ncbi:MAG: TIGR04211 family SH3 domain-containing protein [Desulfofustis sp.]|nr:TIGR04211 family SH3 domain-containing protein [Desulfofustis sp.]